MKLASALSILLLALALPAPAANIAFPEEGDPIVTLNVPDGWEPEYSDDGTLEAADTDDEAYLALWHLESDQDVSTLEKDIDELTNEYAKDVKIAGEAEKVDLNGMPGVLVKAVGKDKENSREIGIQVVLLNPGTPTAMVLYLSYYTDAKKEVVDALNKVISTVKPVKK